MGKKANVTAFFKKGKKENPRTYRAASLTSDPGKVNDFQTHEGQQGVGE